MYAQVKLPNHKEALKKIKFSKNMVDPCIMFSQVGPEQEELMAFYFDKFNFHKKDLSPFVSDPKNA